MRVTKSPEVRKMEILDMAETLFQQKGYAGTAVSDIVEKVGVSQGTFYYYFKSKEEIIEEIIKRQIEKAASSIKGIAEDRALTPPEKIEHAIRAFLQITCYIQGKIKNFTLSDLINLQGKMADYGKKATQLYFREIIEEGKQKNLFHVPQPEISLDFLLGIHACLMRSSYERLPDDVMDAKFEMAGKLMSTVLGAPEGTIQLSFDQTLR